MTGNTGVSLTRVEAIDAMRKGEPCETRYPNAERWVKTRWNHFDDSDVVFRLPPEPRRVAREWVLRDEQCMTMNGPIHVREVLPGDVVLQKMSEATAWRIACKQASDIGFMSPWNGVMAFARALGLIGEGS